jgi:hypothetical protein
MFQINNDRIYSYMENGKRVDRIYLSFIGKQINGEREIAYTDFVISSILNMRVSYFIDFMQKQFGAEYDDFDIYFTDRTKAENAIEHLNVLYKLMNAK